MLLVALPESQESEKVESFMVRPHRITNHLPLKWPPPEGRSPSVEPRLREKTFRQVVRELPWNAAALLPTGRRPQPHALLDPVVPQLKKL